MKTGIPGGLQSLLGKIGINLGQGAEKADGKLAQKGLTAQTKEAKGLEKGAVIGDGKVLAGLGHTPHDKRTGERNLVEQANIDRFLQDPQLAQQQDAAKEQPAAQKNADAAERNNDAREAKEMKETREEVRKEDRADDARHAHGEKKHLEEQREQRETKENERERERERQRDEREKDDENKQGRHEEQFEREEEEKKNGRGMRAEDSLGAYTRCRGHLEDGTRCLRKPMQGGPYCREHLHS